MSDPIDIVERLREALRKAESHPVPAGNAEPVIFVSPTALRAVLCELDELRRENFALAAGQCANAIGDEGGTPVCAEITRLRAALAQPAAPAVTADDFFTLLGHAMALRMEGQTDMPAYLYGLAERIAPDAEHAARARQLSAAPQAPQPGERGA